MKLTRSDVEMTMRNTLWQEINSLHKRWEVLSDEEKETYYSLKEDYYYLHNEEFVQESVLVRQSELYEKYLNNSTMRV